MVAICIINEVKANRVVYDGRQTRRRRSSRGGVIGAIRREEGGYGVVWRRALGDLEDHRSTLHGVDQFARCGPTRVAASQEGFAGKIGPPHILRFGRRTVLPERNE